MSESPAISGKHPVWRYVVDGISIAAILLTWVVIGIAFEYGVSSIGGTGGLFETSGPQLGAVVALTGLLNALLFSLYRAISYWHNYD
ncbi:hypothetical protein [Halostagnicola kamekurae]|uniref:Solute:sodium symporter small subunit n=1 Tax=Halostagnicola kamekurae TaxID=619731 RepID=A0A1I6RMG9_9EURY|nr:hypothetical protein [Halostagnicola kamekurae]SFS65800.1 hypothetical protein SAMN04488556_1901 [Halostagnicola kamekurae]